MLPNEALAELAGKGDGEALEELVRRNMPLIRSIAGRFSGSAEKDDLVQAGAIGLIRAARGFDPSFGTRLTTYAVPFILGEMRLAAETGRRPDTGEQLLSEGEEERITDELLVGALLETLNAEDGELMRLRYLEGLTQRETALRLDISQPTVSRREGRILGALREQAEGSR